VDPILLFVYGTLKRGHRNHRHLAGQEYVGPACTVARYRLFDCGAYPGLVDAPVGGMSIDGELWRVHVAALPDLDVFEDVPDTFERRVVALQDVAGPVFAYFYVRDVSKLGDCGNSWLKR
jgi:gamma-glutamylcyclotransferase (GGCT)/AIG2-like uncharacterized protein YtfP